MACIYLLIYRISVLSSKIDFSFIYQKFKYLIDKIVTHQPYPSSSKLIYPDPGGFAFPKPGRFMYPDTGEPAFPKSVKSIYPDLGKEAQPK